VVRAVVAVVAVPVIVICAGSHPDLNVCKNSSVAGDCSATSCVGDAITCQLLRVQRAVYCDANREDDTSRLGKGLMNGNDPLGSTLPTAKNGDTLDMSGNSIDTSGFLGGGTGLQDKTFTVHGASVTIPLAQMNTYLLALRYAIMLIAMLVSFRMVSGVIFRE